MKTRTNKDNLREYHGRRFVLQGAFGILKSCCRGSLPLSDKIISLEDEVMSALRTQYYVDKARLTGR